MAARVDCVKGLDMKKWIPILLLILIMLAACSAAPATVQPSDTAIATPAVTATPVVKTTPAVTATPLATATPTATQVVTPTVTSVATATPATTVTPTATATPKVTATPTATSTPAKASMPKATKSPTPSPSPSPVPTETPGQPALLVKMAARQGKDLEQMDCEQLVLVVASGSRCKLYAYEKGNNGIWNQVLVTNGYVGEDGVTDNMSERVKKTPMGVYALGFAFGHDANPTTNYPYRKITPDSYWVDDPDSQYYNQWVNGTADKDWDSAEFLWNIKTEYALAVLIEYNYGNATVPGKGSAIFLHVGNKPTAGCIAIPKSDLKQLLGWLDEAKAPHIIISEQ